MKWNVHYYVFSFLVFALPWSASADVNLSSLIEFTGEATNDLAGYSMTTGDVNDDGYEDIIIGVNSNDDAGDNAGAVYLIYGQSSTLSSGSLSTRVEFTGEAANDYAGQSVATGDTNNDGYDDIIVGADNNSDGGSSAGAVYLIYGQSSTLSSGSLSTRVEFTGEAAGDYAGNSVATGDTNNDGYDDIIVGAVGNDDGASLAGAVFLIYGQAALVSGSLSTRVEFTGEAASDNAGRSVATGDINNDGYDELFIGAYFNDDAGFNAGSVYLIYGQSSSLSSSSLSTRLEFTGEAASDNAGYAVTTGDINNDGYDDMLVGAANNDDADSAAGALYLIYGKATSYSSGSLSTRFEFTGEAANDNAGWSVASGDINNDGYDDILVSAVYNDDGGSAAGAVYLISGKATHYSSSLLSIRPQFTGEAASDNAGYAVTTGDINNDGYDDMLVGTPYNDDSASDAGAVYLGYLYIDADGDGVAGTTGVLAIGTDCNDDDSTVSAEQTYYQDSDGDGYGISTSTTSTCSATAPAGYVADSSDINDADFDNDGTSTSLDCNDTDATVYTLNTYYRDFDGDGLGSAVATTTACSLTPPTGYVTNSSDTDDLVSSGDSDNDDDGVDFTTDCNDADATVSEYQTYYQDADGDGFGNPNLSTLVCSVTPPSGYVANDEDTDDTNSTVSHAIEIDGDDVDNDGDDIVDEVNTLEENGEHPEYGDDDVTDSNVYGTDIMGVIGTSDGDILVTYADNSVYQYDVFTVTTTKDTLITMKPDSSLAVVVHPKAKKIALVNVLSGEVFSQKKINSKSHSKVKLLVNDLRTDGKYEAIVVAKRGTKTVHVDLLSIKVASLKLKLRDAEVLKNKHILPSKTKAKKSVVKLRRQNGQVVEQYTVNKKYHLVQ